MEAEKITIATANAQRGRMIRASDGLVPFQNVDVLLLSEVYPKRDNLKEKLDTAGFELVATDDLDLAIAIRKNKGIQFISSQQVSLSKDTPATRFFKNLGIRKFRVTGERNMILAKLRTAQGEEFDVATLHPAVPIRPFARGAQIKQMGDILSRFSKNQKKIIGADFNHLYGPRGTDNRAREAAGLKSTIMGRMRTFRGLFGGQLDDMLYGGEGIQPISTDIINVESDHRAIISTFALEKRSARPLQEPQRDRASLALAA